MVNIILYFQTEKYFLEHMIGGAAVRALELSTQIIQEQYLPSPLASSLVTFYFILLAVLFLNITASCD
jgi:hypothetical protein